MTKITVKDVTRDEVIAQGQEGQDAILLEGTYYFEPATVHMGHMVVTERRYNCPYKGSARCIDLVTPDGKTVRDVAWMYVEPFDKYEYIRNKVGFAFGMRPGVMVEKE